VKHSDLVTSAAGFLRSIHCAVYLTECGHHERPDAIGWTRDGSSVVIECKRTRKDFLAEFSRQDRKAHRRFSAWGMGVSRYYLCPPGVIKVADIHEFARGWGLIYSYGVKRRIVSWPALGNFDRNSEAETRLLVSAMLSRRKRERPQVLQLDLFERLTA
jgi:hypothetical protein